MDSPYLQQGREQLIFNQLSTPLQSVYRPNRVYLYGQTDCYLSNFQQLTDSHVNSRRYWSNLASGVLEDGVYWQNPD